MSTDSDQLMQRLARLRRLHGGAPDVMLGQPGLGSKLLIVGRQVRWPGVMGAHAEIDDGGVLVRSRSANLVRRDRWRVVPYLSVAGRRGALLVHCFCGVDGTVLRRSVRDMAYLISGTLSVHPDGLVDPAGKLFAVFDGVREVWGYRDGWFAGLVIESGAWVQS